MHPRGQAWQRRRGHRVGQVYTKSQTWVLLRLLFQAVRHLGRQTTHGGAQGWQQGAVHLVVKGWRRAAVHLWQKAATNQMVQEWSQELLHSRLQACGQGILCFQARGQMPLQGRMRLQALYALGVPHSPRLSWGQ